MNYASELREAGSIGEQHARNAVSWMFDGNTTTETYEAFRRGLEDGDPEIMDRIPGPDLSGEWADGYLPADLMRDCGIDPDDAPDWLESELCDAYEAGFYDTAEVEVERVVAYQLR